MEVYKYCCRSFKFAYENCDCKKLLKCETVHFQVISLYSLVIYITKLYILKLWTVFLYFSSVILYFLLEYYNASGCNKSCVMQI